jgi:hypothetical protein
MSETTDPPSVERKSVGFGQRVRAFGRKFVNRKTLIFATQVLVGTLRIVRLVMWMLNGF